MSGDVVDCWNCGETYSKQVHEYCPECGEHNSDEPAPEMNYI